MALHAMIDLETLGTRPDGVILSIGGVKFDPNGSKIIDEFYYKLDVDEQTERGRSIDESTIEWWGTQDPAVIEAAMGSEGRSAVKDFLEEFKRWCVGADAYWAQGPTFDMCMLENLYLQYDMNYPWAFWKVRDSRTLFIIMPKDPRKEMNFAAHDALEDCKAQAQCVQFCLRQLRLNIR